MAVVSVSPKHDKTKRIHVGGWQLPVVPRCPVHGVMAVVCKTTYTDDGAMRIQTRKCPVAGCEAGTDGAVFTVKTVIAMKR